MIRKIPLDLMPDDIGVLLLPTSEGLALRAMRGDVREQETIVVMYDDAETGTPTIDIDPHRMAKLGFTVRTISMEESE